MKFLAILRDSLREAIDAKVFYVMIGLSTVLIGLAFSCTFQPKTGGRELIMVASASLMLDLSDENLADPEFQMRLMQKAWQRSRGSLYQVTSVEPEDGQPDAPDSTYLVHVSATLNPLADAPEDHIRKHFGVLDNWHIIEVVEIKRLHKKDGGLGDILRQAFAGEFEVKVRFTSAGKKLWPHSFSLFFGALPIVREGAFLAFQVFILERFVVIGFGAWVAILVSVVLTAFFVPNMLRKGTVDLLLVKPISRTTLLLYKYVGGLLFILINTSIAIVGVWLALGVRSGIWSPAVLCSIPIITFFFAILYSVSVLFAVLTRSPIVSILMTCLVWFVLFVVGVIHLDVFETIRRTEEPRRLRDAGVTAAMLISAPTSPQTGMLVPAIVVSPRFKEISEPLTSDHWFARGIAALYFLLPRTSALDYATIQVMGSEIPFGKVVAVLFLPKVKVNLVETLVVSAIFIALMLALSCWRFATRDY